RKIRVSRFGMTKPSLIDQRGSRQPLGSESLTPFVERQVAGDQRGTTVNQLVVLRRELSGMSRNAFTITSPNTSRRRWSRNNHDSTPTSAGGRKPGSSRRRRSRIPSSVSRGFSRKLSSIAVWWTQEMVQNGAQPFGRAASRFRS